MASILNHLLHITNFKSPLLRTIVPSVGAAFAIQAAAGLPSVLAGTERFFDFSGSLTYLAAGALSLYLPALRNSISSSRHVLSSPNWRQVVVTGMAMTWAARLGYYLFDRITKDEGKDPRFEKLRTQPVRFAASFLVQAMWVSLMLMPVFALNAVPAAALPTAVTLTDVLGISVWAGGLALESAADWQKSRWVQRKKDKQHDEEFLSTGLFALSRFPHYFGEISLWTGLATAAAGALARTPVQLALGFPAAAVVGGGSLVTRGVLATTALAFTAPAFSAFLLTKVSGIPLTEERHDKRLGGNKEYQQWKKDTPKLVPKLW
ncbi:hypothetical protein AAL_03958 [Moelleriella libera RCEF 2490]|uniref:Uncharacterized protein n=1 Tax=Moelleriella libera RCEF 2490 TaxID=1081109 RepID=A0A168CKX8_9HYPO|nr:hypothetical protein AAL_03958 [Moelleriella libera RCEF 2490]